MRRRHQRHHLVARVRPAPGHRPGPGLTAPSATDPPTGQPKITADSCQPGPREFGLKRDSLAIRSGWLRPADIYSVLLFGDEDRPPTLLPQMEPRLYPQKHRSTLLAAFLRTLTRSPSFGGFGLSPPFAKGETGSNPPCRWTLNNSDEVLVTGGERGGVVSPPFAKGGLGGISKP